MVLWQLYDCHSTKEITLKTWVTFDCIEPEMHNASLQWRHNGYGGVSNHQPYRCLHNRLFRRRSKKISSLTFVWGIHRWPVNSPHKWPVTRKIFPIDDVITLFIIPGMYSRYVFAKTPLTDVFEFFSFNRAEVTTVRLVLESYWCDLDIALLPPVYFDILYPYHVFGTRIQK